MKIIYTGICVTQKLLRILTVALLVVLQYSFNVYAGCNTYSPGNDDVVTCTSSSPNPVGTPVQSSPGVSNVSVNVERNSELNNTSGPAVSLGDGSDVLNEGVLKGSSSGVQFREGSSTLVNRGVIHSDSGIAVEFNGNGDNQFTNTGTVSSGINNAIVFGSGNDSFVLQSGQIEGQVAQGNGADQAIIQNGAITGKLVQGEGKDHFEMHGGIIDSLAQGDNRDSFIMTGGTIKGAFVDGDVAQMSGGSIGRVDMKLDNNVFDMSGGRIIGNLVAGFGDDRILVSDGDIGGNISVSGGTDYILISGGQVGGEIRMSNGEDIFRWENSGSIHGAILMGADNDQAILSHLATESVANVPKLDGGKGIDALTIEGTSVGNTDRIVNWERIDLNRGSEMVLDSPLVLGDSDTGSGTLNIDSQSGISAGEQGQTYIRAASSGNKVQVNNTGTIDLTDSGDSVADSLTIEGDYVGNNGTLKLQTELEGDDSLSDKLILSKGHASGHTVIQVTNIEGQGAQISGNGIELVSSINNATSTNTAFSLQNGSISAGAYEYILFKGGVTEGSEHSWYLRNQLIPPQEAGEVQIQAAVGSPQLPTLKAGTDPVPLFRYETPLYTSLVPSIFDTNIEWIGTFHDRRGAQRLLRFNEDGLIWARVLGGHQKLNWGGDTLPSFEGHSEGIQLGKDFWSQSMSNAKQSRIGVMYGYGETKGDIAGLVVGFPNVSAGTLKVRSHSLGGYWTVLMPNDAYLDVIATYSWLDSSLNSVRDYGGHSKGDIISGAIEVGYPIKINNDWLIEPQAQLVGQYATVESMNDGISQIDWDDSERYTARVGARVSGDFWDRVEPYIKTNIWHNFRNESTVKIGSDYIETQLESTYLEVGVGVTSQLTTSIGVYMSVNHTRNLDANDREGYFGNVGIRIDL